MKKRADGRYRQTIVIDGKQKCFYGKTKQEVNQKILKYQTEQRIGPLFDEVANAWWNDKEHTLKDGTIKAYKPALEYSMEEFGGRRISEITPTEIFNSIYKLKVNGFGQKRVDKQHSINGMIWDYYCAKMGGSMNAARQSPKPKGGKKVIRKPPEKTVEQKVVDKINADIKNKAVSGGSLLAAMFYYSGARKGEILALKWSDIDFNKKRIHIENSVTYIGNKPKITTPKTSAGVRDVVLLPKLEEVLRLIPHKGYVVGGGDEPIKSSEYDHLWLDFCKEIGETHTVENHRKDRIHKENMPNVTAHQFRHGFATECYNAGVPMEVAARMMGHEDSQMIKRVYLDINEDMMDDAARLLIEISQNRVR